MKKFLMLFALAAGLILVTAPENAQAQHCSSGYNSFGGGGGGYSSFNRSYSRSFTPSYRYNSFSRGNSFYGNRSNNFSRGYHRGHNHNRGFSNFGSRRGGVNIRFGW